MALKYTRLTRAECHNLGVGQKLNEHGISFEPISFSPGRRLFSQLGKGERSCVTGGKA